MRAIGHPKTPRVPKKGFANSTCRMQSRTLSHTAPSRRCGATGLLLSMQSSRTGTSGTSGCSVGPDRHMYVTGTGYKAEGADYFVESTDTQRGTRVWVQECRRRPTLEGLEGTIMQRFGGDRYVAFEVDLDGDRGRELFWPHELKEVRNQSLWLKLWYAATPKDVLVPLHFAGSECRKKGADNSARHSS